MMHANGVPVADLPLHGWRSLHSVFFDALADEDPDTRLEVMQFVGGLRLRDFVGTFARGVFSTRVERLEDGRVWVFVDFRPDPRMEPEPCFAASAHLLGTDPEQLLTGEAEWSEHLGRTVDQLLESLTDPDGEGDG